MLAHGREWLEDLRKAAIDHFQSVGFPDTGQEEWRLTNVAPIAETKFSIARAQSDDEALDLVTEHRLGTDAAAELVFVNGFYSSELSHIDHLPPGTTLGPMRQAIAKVEHLVKREFGRIADCHANPFVALNTASFDDGALLQMNRGGTIDKPIHILFVSTTGAEPTQSFPRVLVIAEKDSDLTFVESFIGGQGVHFTAAVTEIVARNDCRIDYNRIQRNGGEAYAVTALAARLGRSTQFISHAATLGGKLTRNDLTVTLVGEGADATINGLVIVGEDQHCDNHTLLDHAAAHCASHELYKHVLDGKSTCVFKGKILVRQDSQKTDSKQTSKSLLLSDEAQMNSQPALEIYADDVKCTHGSTTGPVDEEMVFYLRSRGMGLEAARHLLTYAFAADITRRIKVEPVRRRLEDFLAAQHGLPRDLRITDLGEHDEKAR